MLQWQIGFKWLRALAKYVKGPGFPSYNLHCMLPSSTPHHQVGPPHNTEGGEREDLSKGEMEEGWKEGKEEEQEEGSTEEEPNWFRVPALQVYDQEFKSLIHVSGMILAALSPALPGAILHTAVT